MRKLSESEKYNVFIFSEVVRLAPFIGSLAALTFTVSWLCGFFKEASLKELIVFDAFCVLYIIVAMIFKKIGYYKDGEVREKVMTTAKAVLSFSVIIQWNLITYIFPTRDFWGYAPLFLLMMVFFFDSRLTLLNAIALLGSIGISWAIKSELLLPDMGDGYAENLILRVIAIVITFFCLCVISHYGEKALKNADEHLSEAEERSERLDKISSEVITFAADIVEQRDAESGTHVKRVGKYSEILASAAKTIYPDYLLEEEDIDNIEKASYLHDVGKIYIPDTILGKPGKLTEEEYDIVKNHTTIGEKIAFMLPDEMGYKFKKTCADICLYHHERVDGSGYPQGLASEQIPISAQIVSVADCFDALTSDRAYKKSVRPEVAINMIYKGECGVFSDEMISCLRTCADRLEQCWMDFQNK